MSADDSPKDARVFGNLIQILLVFLIAGVIVWVGWRLVGDGAIAKLAVVWVANVGMLVTIWIGLRIRGQGWGHLGLRGAGRRWLLRVVFQSIAVVIFAVVAFIAGSVATSGVEIASKSADMSRYNYLQGNLPMLVLSLAGAWVVSSFGEEVVYRGFLMNRLAEMGRGTRVAWTAAVVISAVVFGLAHFAWGIVGVVQTTFMGLALAVSYLLVKRNLWVLVLAHAYLDTALFVQLYIGSGAPAG